MIKFTILGVAIAKQSTKFFRAGNRVGTYTPAKIKQYQRDVAIQISRIKPETPLTCPISVFMTIYIPRPKSVKRDYPSVKPDLDNYCKQILDCLQGVFFVNDGQVVDLELHKRYAVNEPRVEVIIEELT